MSWSLQGFLPKTAFLFYFSFLSVHSMSWSQLVHPSHQTTFSSSASNPSPATTPDLASTFVLESEMGLASNAAFRSADPVRLPPFHLSQLRVNLSPENFRPIREPEHYEKIDQIGRGEFSCKRDFPENVLPMPVVVFKPFGFLLVKPHLLLESSRFILTVASKD